MYHDLGNLNISFMTTKEEYNRIRNLELICAAIRSVMDVDVSINKVKIFKLTKVYFCPLSHYSNLWLQQEFEVSVRAWSRPSVKLYLRAL